MYLYKKWKRLVYPRNAKSTYLNKGLIVRICYACLISKRSNKTIWIETLRIYKKWNGTNVPSKNTSVCILITAKPKKKKKEKLHYGI